MEQSGVSSDDGTRERPQKTRGKDRRKGHRHMQNKQLLTVDLQLFSDGAAAGAATGEAGEGDAQATASALPKADSQRTGSSRRSKSGAVSNVVYGKQEDAPEAETAGSAAGSNGEGNANESGVSTTSDTLEAKRKAFEELIDGEYKDIYAEKFRTALNRRFKEAKDLEQSLNAQKPIVDMLMQRYKIADGDLGKLQAAIEDDNQYWESAAEEAGLTVEQYKAMQKLERENEELRRIRQAEEGQRRMNQQLEDWYRQADAVKELYPSFNFKREAANRDFLGLLRSGLPVQKAFELMHMDEIKESAARSAAQTAGQQVEARIKSKASRPAENGTSSQSAAVIKSDVSQLTHTDRADIARRVQRGEKIIF